MPRHEGVALIQEAPSQDWTAYHTPEALRREFIPEGTLDRSPLLDKRSEPTPLLNALMDDALMRILLVADGAVMALRERVTGSKDPSTPTSDLAGILDTFGDRYAACKTHRARLLLIKEAQVTEDRLKYAPRAQMRGTTEWKQAIGSDERPCRVVANDYRVSSKTVVACRKAYRKVAR